MMLRRPTRRYGLEPYRIESNISKAAVYVMVHLPKHVEGINIVWKVHEIAWTRSETGSESISDSIIDFYSTLLIVHVPQDGIELFEQFVSTINQRW